MKILKALLVTILLSPLIANASDKGTAMKLLEAIRFYENPETDNTELSTSMPYLMVYAYYNGYASGLGVGDDGRTICRPEGVTSKQYMLIIKKYLEEHPEKLHEPGYLLIDIALMEAFPCEDTEENP